MSKTVTLSGLATEIRNRLELESSDFVSSAELNQYIQDSKDALYDILVSAWGDDYYYSTTTVSTTAGTETVALPSTFYKLLALDFVPAGGDPVELEPFDWEERNDLGSTSQTWDSRDPPRYRIRGGNIWFTPKPAAVYAVKVHYIPACPDLVDAVAPLVSVVFDGINGWTEWIVCDVCAKICAKEESDPSQFLSGKAAVENRIRLMASRRDQGVTAKVRRVKRIRKERAWSRWFK